MEEESLENSLPDLRELENKVGRKTPESLLVCMRDAADCDDGCGSDGVNGGPRSSARNDSLSDKLRNLKQEMKGLRSADARILRQLVAVHEGIEAMRWMMEEEQEASASLSSSLSGSLSSVVTVEERRRSMSPCRGRPNHTQDLTETNGEDFEDPPPNTAHCGLNHKTYPDRHSPDAAARPPRPPASDSEATCSMRERHRQASSSLPGRLSNANAAKSRPQDSDVAPVWGIRPRSDAIRRALIRSSRARGEAVVDTGASAQTKQSEERQTQNQTREGFRPSLNNLMVKEEDEPNRESILLVYDAQWCWVESLDDVTPL